MQIRNLRAIAIAATVLGTAAFPCNATTYDQYVNALDGCNDNYEFKSALWIGCYVSAAGERLGQQLSLFGGLSFVPKVPDFQDFPLRVVPDSPINILVGELDASGTFLTPVGNLNAFLAPVETLVGRPISEGGWVSLGTFAPTSEGWNVDISGSFTSTLTAQPYMLAFSPANSLSNVNPDVPRFGTATIAMVPEPSLITMFGVGLVLLLGYRMKCRSVSHPKI